jgi:exonuclease III
MLPIVFWNIDGMFKRIGNQRFCKIEDKETETFLCKYDIVCLVETHCSTNDKISLPGYKLLPNIRPKIAGSPHNFGGIAIFIKDNIYDGIKPITNNNSELSWIKLSKSFFNLDKDLYISTCYISPASSSFTATRDDIFELLEDDIARYSKTGHCLICGDFNAKTAKNRDYCIDDDTFSVQHLNDYMCDTPIVRNNSDIHKVDTHGTKLLSLCKTSGFRILNGRCFGDYFGRCTCYSYTGQPSTIDYMLTSVEFLDKIECFVVNEPCDKSIHCSLSCVIKTGNFRRTANQVKDNRGSFLPKFMWSDGDDEKFLSALSLPIIRNKIEKCTSSYKNLSIDGAVNAVTDILISSAVAAKIKRNKCGKVKNSKLPCKKQTNAWFDKECRIYKTKLKEISSQIHRNPYNLALLQEFRSARKRYKSMLVKKKNMYSQGILTQLEVLHPQAYWKLFEQLKGTETNKVASCPISSKEWVDHFSTLVTRDSDLDSNFNQYMTQYVLSNKEKIFNELNLSISEQEIINAIRTLKKGKACGPDLVLNEMIKTGQTVLVPLLHKLFNKILVNGEFPKAWGTNFLTPLHKKGDIHNPCNYRGIAVGSHLSKLFSSVLQNRLTGFAETHKLIPVEQIGFKKKFRTSDHIFTLKTLIEKYAIGPKKYLYSCFIDFKTAFDTISRTALIYKLLKADIGGNFLGVLQSMYSNVSYSVKVNNQYSENFHSSVGVKQGCVLSPLLFSLFMRDLPNIFSKECDPVKLFDIDLSCLMFADDLILFSRSSTGLQNALNNLDEYCNKWGLHVNLTKTKVIIFNKGGHLIKKFSFTFQGNIIEIVQSYCYLGIIFTASGSFKPACERLCDQASKALFKLKQLNVRNNIPVALQLFKCLILPILMYGSEIWSPYYLKGIKKHNLMTICENLPAEKLVIKFYKYLLGVHKHATNAAVRGELGQFGLLTSLLPHAFKYWLRLTTFDTSSLCYKAYLLSYDANSNINWAGFIKYLSNSYGLTETWDNQGSLYKNKSASLLKQSLQDTYVKDWADYIGLPPEWNYCYRKS